MKFYIEKHKYAPELNKIHFDNGATMATPYCTTTKEVREKYFKKPTTFKKVITIVTHYPQGFKGLERKHKGAVRNIKEIKQALNMIDKKLIKKDSLDHEGKPFGFTATANITTIKSIYI